MTFRKVLILGIKNILTDSRLPNLGKKINLLTMASRPRPWNKAYGKSSTSQQNVIEKIAPVWMASVCQD